MHFLFFLSKIPMATLTILIIMKFYARSIQMFQLQFTKVFYILLLILIPS
jgi:hypothetical protein